MMNRLVTWPIKKALTAINGGEYTHPLVPHKKKFIAGAVEEFGLTSIIDAGGCWGVHGGYTFHALQNPGLKTATIIDGHITETTEKRAAKYAGVSLVHGGLGDRSLVDGLAPADGVMLLDILLHQVSPDWGEFIELYAAKTNHFLIYNQMYVGSENTVRLMDLGLEEYLKHTPYARRRAEIKELFERRYDSDPKHNRPFGDLHFYWQWGITRHDLVEFMSKIGFTLDRATNYGRIRGVSNFEHHGYLFSRAHVI